MAAGQQGQLQGFVVDSLNHPVEGATIFLHPMHQTLVSDERGIFIIPPGISIDSLSIYSIGYQLQQLALKDFKMAAGKVTLHAIPIQLNTVTITAAIGNPYRPISSLDIRMRGINNSQEVLRMVPGLFIGQHAGGGKAEQIFLRGFDLDHGTDINISVDGMPVNMVSHAHGQGYADLHFLIPELIGKVNFKKGTYDPSKGNFTTTGFVDFQTKNELDSHLVKLEAGKFNTLRTVGMFNLLKNKKQSHHESAFIATEYMYTKGYFEHPQNFNRFNIIGKFNFAFNDRHSMSMSASAFSSGWKASGQIPERAVQSGLIGFYGAIDPDEGGKTSRNNIQATFTSNLNDGSYFKNQLFYSRYNFELFSNFTFYKIDSVNGDQIKQKEHRNLFGYNGKYHRTDYLGNIQLSTEIGLNLRFDDINNSELSRTRHRKELLQRLSFGNIEEQNFGAYISENFSFSSRVQLNTSLRFDRIQNRYTDFLHDGLKASAAASILSPKMNLSYQLNPLTQVYISAGKGFHSNDTRVVVPRKGKEIMPAAYSSDLGLMIKPVRNLLLHAALWYLWLDQEFIYVGDESVIEPGGKTRRIGFDFSSRYAPLSWLYVDMDLNYSLARAVNEPRGEDYLPLAPAFTSVGGISANPIKGWDFSLRYRYMGKRPATEDYSIIADGYFITDAMINYSFRKYDIGLAIQNLFNKKWKETQFETTSRLQNESAPISEIHFTPGNPLFAKLIFSYRF